MNVRLGEICSSTNIKSMPKHVLRAAPYEYFLLVSRIIDFLPGVGKGVIVQKERTAFFPVGIFRPEPQAPGATTHRSAAGAWMDSAPIGSTKSKHVLPKTPLEERYARQRQYNNQRDKGDTEPCLVSSVYFEGQIMVLHSFLCEVDI